MIKRALFYYLLASEFLMRNAQSTIIEMFVTHIQLVYGLFLFVCLLRQDLMYTRLSWNSLGSGG